MQSSRSNILSFERQSISAAHVSPQTLSTDKMYLLEMPEKFSLISIIPQCLKTAGLRTAGGRVRRVLKSPLTYLQYLHTAMQGEGRRSLACVTTEAEEKLWEAEEQYSTAASTLINSSTPGDSPKHNSLGRHPCTSHQPCLWLHCSCAAEQDPAGHPCPGAVGSWQRSWCLSALAMAEVGA